MKTKFNSQNFSDYCLMSFRNDLNIFLASYNAETRLRNEDSDVKAFDSNCRDSNFLECELSNERKLNFITCFGYLLECEHKLFVNPKSHEYTFDCCRSFCRAFDLPFIYSGPGSGMMGARYQLNQFRLIPYDADGRASLWEFISSADDSLKDVFRVIFDGKCSQVSNNESYVRFLEEFGKGYTSFDEFWFEVQKGLNKMSDIDPNTLIGHNVWVRRQGVRPQNDCKAIEYCLNKTNGFKKDVDSLLERLKDNKPSDNGVIKFNKDICFTKLSDNEEKDVYFRACWTYLYALIESMERHSISSFARLVGYDVAVIKSILETYGLFDVEMGMTPTMSQKYLETLQEMSWQMEDIITDFLQGKSEVWSGNVAYIRLVRYNKNNTDYIWEKILNHIENKKTEVVRIDRNEKSISIQLSHFYFHKIEMIKVESEDGDYYIGKTPVTDSQYGAITRQFCGSIEEPVTNVPLKGVTTFIERLSQITGMNFRLPTAKEWIFAAKGGKNSKGYRFAGSDNLEEVAWCRYNAEGKVHKVAKKKPNELGLYDMSGNVWEMTSDVKYWPVAPAARVVKSNGKIEDTLIKNLLQLTDSELGYPYDGVDCGGCFYDKENNCETGKTSTFDRVDIKNGIMGFRLVCTE